MEKKPRKTTIYTSFERIRDIIPILVLLSVFLLFDLNAFSLSTKAAARYDGDLDGNGNITASDARLALRLAVELEEFSFEQKMLADIDYNGEVTAADARSLLRMAVNLDKKQTYSDPVFYANEYFSLTFPASWRGHFFVREEKILNDEAEHIAYWICNTEEYPHYRYSPDYVVCFIDVIPGNQHIVFNDNCFNYFRYVEGKDTFSLHFHMQQPGYLDSLQASRAIYANLCKQMPNVLNSLQSGTGGYTIGQYDYRNYEGIYFGTNTSAASVYELDVWKTNGPVLYFTYGLYSQSHVNEVENGTVVITNGSGKCYVVDGWGNSLEMHFRLHKGKIYVTVSGINGASNSTIATRLGEKEFAKME